MSASAAPQGQTLDFRQSWLMDTGATYHLTHDRSVLTSFTHTTSTEVGGIGGDLVSPGYGTARIRCKTPTGESWLNLHGVLYVPNCPFNLISWSQLEAAGCPLSLIPKGFGISNHDIHCTLYQGLYPLQLEKPVALLSVNEDTLQMWHERLGHVGKAETIAMTQKAGIDLSKPPPADPCIPCGRAAGKTEPHRAPIKPGRWAGDLIHGDLMGPFPMGYNKAKWIVCWLDDKTQMSYVQTLYSKEAPGLLESFKTFLDIIEHGLNRCTRIRIDNGTEPTGGVFAAFRNERGIRTEPSTACNLQMNGCAERLNQTLMRKASTFHKDSGLPLKWWPEFLNTANHLRNVLTSTSVSNDKGQHISPFEASTGYPYPIQNLRRIGQAGEYLVTKPNTGWKKWTDRREPGILVGYEEEHIYRVITTKGTIHRSSNVEWRRNKRPHSHDTSSEGATPTASAEPQQTPRSEIDVFLDNLAVQLDEDRPTAVPQSRQKSTEPSIGTNTSPSTLNGSPAPTPTSSTSTLSGEPAPTPSSNETDELAINTPNSDSEASSQTLQQTTLENAVRATSLSTLATRFISQSSANGPHGTASQMRPHGSSWA